jgi:DNA-binding Lrp family transcriptional regulator
MDTRFNRYPKALRVLAYCCGHARQWTAVFWINQQTMAIDMQSSQQAVSEHMRRLVEWGYIEKIKREDNRRRWGKQGAVWRVIFDPTKTYNAILKMTPPADAKTPEEEAKEAEKMMSLAARGAKGQLTKAKKHPVDKSPKPVDKSEVTQAPACINTQYNPNVYKPQLVKVHKPQLVSKHHNRTIYKEDKEDECRKICNHLSQAVTERYGRGWAYDQRQMKLAGELIDLGYTSDSFNTDMRSVLDWMVKNNKQPPQSLQYFIKRKEAKGKGKTKTEDNPISLLKKTTRGLRMT